MVVKLRIVAPPKSTRPVPIDFEPEWFWEGNIQSKVCEYLAAEEWTIRRVADTASRMPGIDIMATKGGQWLGIEVKGYPSRRYARGPTRGHPKLTRPAQQAHHWYASAMLAALRAKHAMPNIEVRLAFPLVGTYLALFIETRAALRQLRIGVYFVSEDGRVEAYLPSDAGEGTFRTYDPLLTPRC